MASKSRRLGFAQPFPQKKAAALGRTFQQLNTNTMALARETMAGALDSRDPIQIENALRQFENGLAGTMPDVAGAARRAGQRADRAHRRLFLDAVTRTVRAPVISPDNPVVEVGARPGALPLLMPGNIEPSLSVDIFERENERLMDKLQGGIVDGMRQRIAEVEDPAELMQEWEDFGMPSRVGKQVTNVEAHAMLIANDQMGTMIGEMTRSRQQSVGITEFVWRTKGDGKVREQHADWNRKVFNWNQGAGGGTFPGEPINCRCWAQAVIDPVLMRESMQQIEAA
jgi:SPP1 gp7 family putative phage head morphogenesis protein